MRKVTDVRGSHSVTGNRPQSSLCQNLDETKSEAQRTAEGSDRLSRLELAGSHASLEIFADVLDAPDWLRSEKAAMRTLVRSVIRGGDRMRLI